MTPWWTVTARMSLGSLIVNRDGSVEKMIPILMLKGSFHTWHMTTVYSVNFVAIVMMQLKSEIYQSCQRHSWLLQANVLSAPPTTWIHNHCNVCSLSTKIVSTFQWCWIAEILQRRPRIIQTLKSPPPHGRGLIRPRIKMIPHYKEDPVYGNVFLLKILFSVSYLRIC